jgi:hypothetical protein
MGNLHGEGIATPTASSAMRCDRPHIVPQISLRANNIDFKSRWNRENARSRPRATTAKKNLRRKSNPQKYKTTVMRACLGKKNQVALSHKR